MRRAGHTQTPLLGKADGPLPRRGLRCGGGTGLVCASHFLVQVQKKCVPRTFSFRSYVFKFPPLLEPLLGNKILEDKFIRQYVLKCHVSTKIREQSRDKPGSRVLKK